MTAGAGIGPPISELVRSRVAAGRGRARLHDGIVLGGRAVLRMRRYPGLIFAIVIFPVFFLTGFVLMFSRSFERAGLADYVHYLLPIVVVQALFFTGMGAAVSVADDAEHGLLTRFRSLPMSDDGVFLGVVLGYLVRAVIVLLVVVALGVVYGFRFGAGAGSTVAFVGLSLGFVVVTIAGYVCLGLAVRNSETTQSIVVVPYAPLLLLSTGFSPEENWPGWLQPVVANNPVSWVAEALRVLAGGGAVAEPVLWSAGWLLALGAVFTGLAGRLFRRAGA